MCQVLEIRNCTYYAHVIKEATFCQMSKAINSYQFIVMEVSASSVCGTFHAE